jgi:hypothetical protein
MRHAVALSIAMSTLAAPAAGQTVYGLVGSERIVTFNAADPGAITSNRPITGLGAGETLLGIDFRPLDNLIYTVSSSSNVYRLTPGADSFVATLTGALQTFPFPGSPVALAGSNFGIDFAGGDRIRLVSDLDQRLRINPLNGGTAIDPLATDGTGATPYDLIGIAQTSSFAGSTTSAPYAIDGLTSSLVRGQQIGSAYFNTSLSGVVFDPLGLSLTSQSQVGFDILYAGGVNSAYLSFDDGFYDVDLETGRAALIGAIGVGNVRGITLAAVPEPTTWALMLVGFGAVGLALRRRARPARRVRMAGKVRTSS